MKPFLRSIAKTNCTPLLFFLKCIFQNCIEETTLEVSSVCMLTSPAPARFRGDLVACPPQNTTSRSARLRATHCSGSAGTSPTTSTCCTSTTWQTAAATTCHSTQCSHGSSAIIAAQNWVNASKLLPKGEKNVLL